ncbi:MAG TPA: DUF484 family protein [Burkholderiaceae bacterium]|nr:DUF484 family protein [Burkholderiaceae bacterium]
MNPDDIARYLTEHPEFFDEHPDVLGALSIPHPQNGAAISLMERQSLVLRDRIRQLEGRMAELLRHGEENDVIADKVVRWARALLMQADAAHLPDVAVGELKEIFSVPFCAVRVWDVAPDYADLPCAVPVGEDVVRLANSMGAPFCGSNVGFEAAQWMNEGDAAVIQSLAMLPLRVGASAAAFGLLVLGSPDKDRFQITMGTAFLSRIAELASAALARLRP